MMPTSLRECIRLSIDHSIQNLSESRIVVLHPGYDAPDDFLVALVAADCQNGGLDHETARMLCSIIANNKEGFFSLDRQGFKSVTEDSLAPGRSFFHVARPQPGEGMVYLAAASLGYYLTPQLRTLHVKNLPPRWPKPTSHTTG